MLVSDIKSPRVFNSFLLIWKALSVQNGQFGWSTGLWNYVFTCAICPLVGNVVHLLCCVIGFSREIFKLKIDRPSNVTYNRIYYDERYSILCFLGWIGH